MSESVCVQGFEVFKEALTDFDLQVAIIQKLQSLAKVLGEKTTREDLLPFIEQHYVELHDEALLSLAEQLQWFVPLVGGLEHSKIVFDLLGKLCLTDENVVRERAVETIIAIQREMNAEEMEQYLLPVINGLIKDDWFTSKCSAMMLFPTFYPKLSEKRKTELRNNFKTLIQDDSPMVRKAAANSCINFASVIEERFLKNEFVPIFQDIAQDPMDFVRMVTIDIALILIKRVDQEVVFKTIECISDDASWRVRYHLASNIATFQQQLIHGKYRGKLIAIYQKLTQAIEPEIRQLAASNLFSYCKALQDSYLNQPQNENNFEPVFEQSIMSIIQKLAVDESEEVRLALSSNILPLSTILSEDCFKKNIVSFLLQVLNTEVSIAIQTNFLLGLSNLSSNVDLTKSLGAIKNAVRAVIVRSHANWRTRRSVLKTFIDITKFCDANYFSDHFKIYYAALLGDPVFAVRRSASMVLPIISKRYGIKWAYEHLVPFFTMFSRDTRYLYRFVSLFGISEMIRPHLCVQQDLYLKDFKKLVENNNKKAIMALVKIIKTSHLIQKQLKEEKYSSILKLQDDLDYFSRFDDAIVYSEKDFDKLKNINVYLLEEREVEPDQWPYLQGILGLIYNKFLPIIDSLNRDSTENVQIRAICTLGEISDLITKLAKEESESWVLQCFKSLTPEELATLNDEIHHEFKTVDFKDEDLLDVNLLKDIEEIELNKAMIKEENSNFDPLDGDKDKHQEAGTSKEATTDNVTETTENELR